MTKFYVQSIDHKLITGLDIVLDNLKRLEIYLNFKIEHNLGDKILPFEKWCYLSNTYGCNLKPFQETEEVYNYIQPVEITKSVEQYTLWWASPSYIKELKENYKEFFKRK